MIFTGGALLASAALTAGAGMVTANAARKSAQAAANNAKVDISALDQQTRDIARQNALDSAELERQLTPEVPQLRTAANQAVLGGIGGDPNQRKAVDFLMQRFGQPIAGAQSTPLLNSAIEKARADLGLGGRLSLDQRNEATRRGAAQAGSVSGGLGLGRDLSARDLGLTSYGVEQQRLQNATSLGGLELNRENSLFNRGLADNQNFLSQYSLLNSYYNNLRQQDLAAAAYGQSIAPPVVGLDPSAVANVTVGNQNNATQAALGGANIRAQQAQNLMGFGGQLLGYGLMGGFGGGAKTATAAPISNVY